MSRSPQSKSSLTWIATLATLLLTVIVALVGWPLLRGYAHNQAEQQASIGARLEGANAIAHYRLALVLDPSNALYRTQLAKLYLEVGDSDSALSLVEPLNSTDARVLRSQALLEQNQGDKALAAVQGSEDAAAIDQLGLCEAVLGHSSELQTLIKQQSGASQQSLTRMASSRLSLAQVLYQKGLYRTTARVVASAQDSATKYELLARSLASQKPSSKEQLRAAKGQAEAGVKLYPSSITLRELLRDLDNQVGDKGGATEQTERINQLESGKL